MAVKKQTGTGSTQKSRFLVGTDTPVIRLRTNRPALGKGRRAAIDNQKNKPFSGKMRFVWAVKEDGGGYRPVSNSKIELR